MAVDDLLDQLQHKFDGVSSEIFGKCEHFFFPNRRIKLFTIPVFFFLGTLLR